MMKLTLKLLSEYFTIHSLPAHSEIPPQVFSAPIYFIGKTFDETSIVLPQNISINSDYDFTHQFSVHFGEIAEIKRKNSSKVYLKMRLAS